LFSDPGIERAPVKQLTLITQDGWMEYHDIILELRHLLLCGIACFTFLVSGIILVVQRHDKGTFQNIDGKWEWRKDTDYGF
jgi:hypothetical protein